MHFRQSLIIGETLEFKEIYKQIFNLSLAFAQSCLIHVSGTYFGNILTKTTKISSEPKIDKCNKSHRI